MWGSNMLCKNRKGQSAVEYFIIFTIILVLVITTGTIGRIRTAFEGYFNKAVEHMM